MKLSLLCPEKQTRPTNRIQTHNDGLAAREKTSGHNSLTSVLNASERFISIRECCDNNVCNKLHRRKTFQVSILSESVKALFTMSKFILLTNIYYAHICKGKRLILQQLGNRNSGSDWVDSIFTSIKELYKPSRALHMHPQYIINIQ